MRAPVEAGYHLRLHHLGHCSSLGSGTDLLRAAGCSDIATLILRVCSPHQEQPPVLGSLPPAC